MVDCVSAFVTNELSTPVEGLLLYEVDDMREGATVDGGGVKNDRSSRVSRKSLKTAGSS